MPSLERLFLSFTLYPESLTSSEIKIINLSLKYKSAWSEIVREMKLSSKAEAIKLLRHVVGILLRSIEGK